MKTNTTFSFMEPRKHTTQLEAHILFHIERISHSIAHVYFTDEHNSPIEKPRSFHVHSYDSDGDIMRSVIQRPVNNQHYFLCYTDNYSIEYAEIVIMTIDAQRTWLMNIHIPEIV